MYRDSIQIKSINEAYKDLLTEKNIIFKCTQLLMVITSEILFTIAIYSCVNKITNLYSIKMIILLFIFYIVHYLMGMLLHITSNIHKFMYLNKEKSIKYNFLLSYLITSSNLFVLLVYPNVLRKYLVVAGVGVAISYILNMKIVYLILKNPKYIKLYRGQSVRFETIALFCIILVFFILLNLFLGVALTNLISSNAYTNFPSNFDLLYYTVVTFTTIGFGDISPVSVEAKFMAILISFTSIICLTIFLGGLFSFNKGDYF